MPKEEKENNLEKALDPNLPWLYENFREQNAWLETSWLETQKKLRILVTGASSWLARYLLHILMQEPLGEILVVDVGERPLYLDLPRYQGVSFFSLKKRLSDLQAAIASFRPQLIFHADILWERGGTTKAELYERNVWEVEVLCQSAEKADARRILLFSDFSIYGPGAQMAEEDTPLAPSTLLGKTFEEAENIASLFHKQGEIEIYHLRLAPLYGPMIPCGIMLLARLMADGFLLAPLHNLPSSLSMLSGADLALAAYGLAFAPKLEHRVWNVASQSITMPDLLRQCAQVLLPEKILGFSTRLASIMKIGYQEEIRLPESWFRFLASLSEDTTDFLNALRAEKKSPNLSQSHLNTILGFRELSSQRIMTGLGWRPTPAASLREALEYAQKHGWHREKRSIRKKMDGLYPVYEGLRPLMEAWNAEGNDEETEEKFYTLPLLGFAIDEKSFRILMERAWNVLGLLLLQGTNRPLSKSPVDAISYAAEKILDLIRYENMRAKKLFEGDPQAQFKWMIQTVGGLNAKQVQFYSNLVLVSEGLHFCARIAKEYAPLVALLPEKKYGIFLASDRGDIGIVLEVADGKIVVDFPRKEIDALSRAFYFPKRLSEFQKVAHLHIVVGARLERLFSDLISGSFLKNLIASFGKEYILSESTQYYRMIASAMKKSNVNTYIFLDDQKEPIFGFILKKPGISMVSSSYLEMIRQIREEVPDYKDIAALLSAASQGKEEVTFLGIETVKRILSGMIAPSSIRKLLLKILGRMSGMETSLS